MKVPKLPKVNPKKPFEVAGKWKKSVDNRLMPGKNEAKVWKAKYDEAQQELANLRKSRVELTQFAMEKKPLRKRDSRRIIVKKAN